MNRFREWASRLKQETATLWFCTRHPRTPVAAKVLAVALVVYAFSPIDLIPDFIPVLGYLDDLVILPVGVWLVLKLTPPDVLEECRLQAREWAAQKRPKPRSYAGAAIVIVLWIAALWFVWRWAVSSVAY